MPPTSTKLYFNGKTYLYLCLHVYCTNKLINIYIYIYIYMKLSLIFCGVLLLLLWDHYWVRRMVMCWENWENMRWVMIVCVHTFGTWTRAWSLLHFGSFCLATSLDDFFSLILNLGFKFSIGNENYSTISYILCCQPIHFNS